MKLLKIVFLSTMLTSVVFSQNTDSLFQELLRIRGIVKEPAYTTITSDSHKPIKCGFPIIGQLLEHSHELSLDKQAQLKILLQRPERETSKVSPGGFFRIHYDLSGSHAPAYFFDGNEPLIDSSVNALAAAFDSSYRYEVDFLGYPPPSPDDGEGGDNRFDVYIGDIGPPTYGLTTWSTGSGNIFDIYIEVDNDFLGGFPEGSEGINGAMVTAAHEFHHAIQLDNYGFFSNDIYYHELTSTSMEEFVFDEVNDYYNYLSSYFYSPDRDIASYSGYDLAQWNIYLRQKFENEGDPEKGFDIIKRSWEILSQDRVAIRSLSQSLFEHGTTFKNEFGTYGLWCYFTGHRAKPDLYFSEGENYPLLYMRKYDYTPPKKRYELRALEPASNYYMEFMLITENSRDTLISIITNNDIDNSGATFPETISADYYLTTEYEPGAVNIVNDYYSIIESDNPGFLSEANIFNSIIVSGDTLIRATVDYAFPQPFRYSDNYIFIPVKNNNLGFADLKIYTVGLDLIYEGRESIIPGEKIVVRWDGRDSNGNKVSTGVYIYATSSEDNILTGKFVIYND